MIHRKYAAMAAMSIFALMVGNQRADADLQLSFDSSSYTVDGSNSVTVSVYATQTASGPQVGVGNELVTAGIVLNFDNPAGIAAIQSTADIVGNGAFDSYAPGLSATAGTLDETSVAGISDLSAPLLLGTFKLTGLAPGSTLIQVASEVPGVSFITAGGDIVDPANVATATVNVPEPATLAILGGAMMMLGFRRRRKAAP